MFDCKSSVAVNQQSLMESVFALETFLGDLTDVDNTNE